MSDYQDSDFDESQSGYYRIWYGRTLKPVGPFETVTAMAMATNMTDYPDDGYVVFFDKDNGISSVPSLNPDELVQVADRYGRTWPDVSVNERCPTCGQPDNCGDCEHGRLTDDDVKLLGGILPTSSEEGR